jgi:hypothetical protein
MLGDDDMGLLDGCVEVGIEVSNDSPVDLIVPIDGSLGN